MKSKSLLTLGAALALAVFITLNINKAGAQNQPSLADRIIKINTQRLEGVSASRKEITRKPTTSTTGSSCVTFQAGQYYSNIVAYAITSHGPDVPMGLFEYMPLPQIIDECTDAGFLMHQDGTFFVFTRSVK